MYIFCLYCRPLHLFCCSLCMHVYEIQCNPPKSFTSFHSHSTTPILFLCTFCGGIFTCIAHHQTNQNYCVNLKKMFFLPTTSNKVLVLLSSLSPSVKKIFCMKFIVLPSCLFVSFCLFGPTPFSLSIKKVLFSFCTRKWMGRVTMEINFHHALSF